MESAAAGLRAFEQHSEHLLNSLGSGPDGLALGVLYVGRNQGNDPEAVWRNCGECSAAFQSLLDILAEKTALRGSKLFTGGCVFSRF